MRMVGIEETGWDGVGWVRVAQPTSNTFFVKLMVPLCNFESSA